MKRSGCQLLPVCLGALALVALAARGELFISEILFNPPGTDDPNEYIELRGTPNLTLPAGTWFVAIEGDATGNPGTILNAFDLSGRRIGGNGFLVLLQKTNSYLPDSKAAILVNTNSGPGWGSGASSSVGHFGKDGITDLKNPSVTFLLVQTTNAPVVGNDIDPDNDGIPDGPAFAGWTVLDSIGILDADGTGDIAYGAVNFRRNTAPGNGARAAGVIVPVGFTPRYVARAGNTTGATASDWVATDGLGGTAPNWTMGSSANTYPSGLAGAALNHLGAPNFVEANNTVLLNELKVNPPGSTDGPFEFIEVRGVPGVWLTNVSLLALEGSAGADPGTITWSLNLTGVQLGSNGLLLVAATDHPYSVPAETTVVTDPRFSQTGGALKNGAASFLLVSSVADFRVGDDLDKGDNGILEGLPADATILDAVGWASGNTGDLVYGGVVLTQSSGTPDAAVRLPGNVTPNSAAAWLCGSLLGPNGDSLIFDNTAVSSNFPIGTVLTPGQPNNTAPAFSSITPVSGVIGDPNNPVVAFSLADAETPGASFTVAATSSNPLVVPDHNLAVTGGAGGIFALSISPVGVGYANITLSVSDGQMTGTTTFPYAASAPGRPGGVWHLGASDGSTAIPVGSDFMFIGDDESQTLRLYRRHESGLPVAQFDMNPFLALPDVVAGQRREVDIEASTRVGNRLFWIGSHGHAGDGEIRTNRTRVFATDLSGTNATATLAYVGRYDYLKLDLIYWDSNNLHGKGTNYYGLAASDADGVAPKAPDGSGFNIEGLAMMPGSTNGAYVSFRAPLVPPGQRTYALIVPVLNFASVAAGTGPPGSCVFGPPIELDLYGRGIRSIEGGTNGYVIIGGPPGPVADYPRDFRLYTWSGNPADQPQQRTADLAGLNPEGIVEAPPGAWTATTQIELISDCGTAVYYGDGLEAKTLKVPNFKKCRSDLAALGAITPPVPIITSISLDASTFVVRWRSLQGLTYRLQSATDLLLGDWQDVPGDIVAAGPTAAKEIPLVSGSNRCFYRLYLPN